MNISTIFNRYKFIVLIGVAFVIGSCQFGEKPIDVIRKIANASNTKNLELAGYIEYVSTDLANGFFTFSSRGDTAFITKHSLTAGAVVEQKQLDISTYILAYRDSICEQYGYTDQESKQDLLNVLNMRPLLISGSGKTVFLLYQDPVAIESPIPNRNLINNPVLWIELNENLAIVKILYIDAKKVQFGPFDGGEVVTQTEGNILISSFTYNHFRLQLINEKKLIYFEESSNSCIASLFDPLRNKTHCVVFRDESDQNCINIDNENYSINREVKLSEYGIVSIFNDNLFLEKKGIQNRVESILIINIHTNETIECNMKEFSGVRFITPTEDGFWFIDSSEGKENLYHFSI